MTVIPADPTSPLIIENAQLIGADWLPASDGQTIDVTNPATGQVLGRVPRGGAADIRDTLKRFAQQYGPRFQPDPGWDTLQ